MGLLDSLLQGGQDRDAYQDFVNPLRPGSDYEGISDNEATGLRQARSEPAAGPSWPS
jgi:hypothetical protein